MCRRISAGRLAADACGRRESQRERQAWGVALAAPRSSRTVPASPFVEGALRPSMALERRRASGGREREEEEEERATHLVPHGRVVCLSHPCTALWSSPGACSSAGGRSGREGSRGSPSPPPRPPRPRPLLQLGQAFQRHTYSVSPSRSSHPPSHSEQSFTSSSSDFIAQASRPGLLWSSSTSRASVGRLRRIH